MTQAPLEKGETGSPGGTPQVNQSPPSPMQGSGTGPQAKVQHLSQNGSLSLSMSCSFACEGWGVGAAGYPEGVPARRAEVKTEMPSDLLGQMGIGAVVGAFCPRRPGPKPHTAVPCVCTLSGAIGEGLKMDLPL